MYLLCCFNLTPMDIVEARRLCHMVTLLSMTIQVTSSINLETSQNQKDNYSRLYRDLFEDYSKIERPRDIMDTTVVWTWLAPLRIIYLDDRQQSLKMLFLLGFGWVDLDLVWNQSKYGDIESIRRDQSSLWLPPVLYYNSVDEGKSRQLGYDQNDVIIHSTGRVAWEVTEEHQFHCPIDIHAYPFDVQNCSIILSLYHYNASDVWLKTVPKYPIIETTLFESDGTWEVLRFTCTERNVTSETEHFRMIYFNVVLRRRLTYFLVNIILPLVVLSFTAPMVFLLPAESTEKIVMCVTVLLAYSIYISSISGQLPRTSQQWCILQVYLAALFAYTCLAIILSVIVIRIHHISPDKPPGERLSKYVMAARKLLHLRVIWKLDIVPNANNNNVSVGEPEVQDSKEKPPETQSSLIPPLFGSNTSVEASDEQASCSSQISLPGFSRNVRTRFRNGPGSPFELDVVFSSETMPVIMTWPRVAEAVDRALFYIFFTIILLVTCSTFLYLAFVHSDQDEDLTYGHGSWSKANAFPESCGKDHIPYYKEF